MSPTPTRVAQRIAVIGAVAGAVLLWWPVNPDTTVPHTPDVPPSAEVPRNPAPLPEAQRVNPPLPSPAAPPPVANDRAEQPSRPGDLLQRAVAERIGAATLRCELGPHHPSGSSVNLDFQDPVSSPLPDGAHGFARDGALDLVVPVGQSEVRVVWRGLGEATVTYDAPVVGQAGTCLSVGPVTYHTGVHGGASFEGFGGRARVVGCGVYHEVDPDGSFFLSVPASPCEVALHAQADDGSWWRGPPVALDPEVGVDIVDLQLAISPQDAVELEPDPCIVAGCAEKAEAYMAILQEVLADLTGQTPAHP